MPLLVRFAPPAYLSDFDEITGQLDAWHNAVSAWFDDSIKDGQKKVKPGILQFYNPAKFDPGGSVIEQTIVWNAFPKELLRRFGRDEALRQADTLWTVNQYYSIFNDHPVNRKQYPALFETFFRPQQEYCEWRVTRDPRTNSITNITFTSEPPEYWFGLFGSHVINDEHGILCPGDPKVGLELYKSLVGPRVTMHSLIARRDVRGPEPNPVYMEKGQYNIYNKWNTTHGIVHLCAPPNALTAEIQLSADATLLRKNRRGRLLVEPEALICCAGYGGPDRNSDPTIGATVNALARLGAYVTLKNPVGLYMDHIDLSAWEAPDRKTVTDCVRIVRGRPGMIERLVVEVPPARGFTVGEIKIGGENIAYGGQVAECITVKLIAIAKLQKQPVHNHPLPCSCRCCLDAHNPRLLIRAARASKPLPRGKVEAFVLQGVEEFLAPRRKKKHTTKVQPRL